MSRVGIQGAAETGSIELNVNNYLSPGTYGTGMLGALAMIGGALVFWVIFVVIVGMPLNLVAQGLLLIAGGFVGRSLWNPHPVRMAKGVVAGGLFVTGLLLTNSFTPANDPGVLGPLLAVDVSVGSRHSQLVIDYTWGFFAGILVDLVDW